MRLRWGLLFAGTTVWASPIHPRHAESVRPPTPLLGIAADIRRVSHDESFRIDPPDKEPPKPAPPEEKKAEPTPTPTPDPPAPDDTPPAPDENDGDESNPEGKAQKHRAPSSLREQLEKEHAKLSLTMTREHEALAAKWERAYQEDVRRWTAEHQNFLKRIPEYRAGLSAMVGAPANSKAVPIKAASPELPQASQSGWQLVSSALELPIRDQGRRGTCAAFAGVRALEMMLAQNGQGGLALSEQYFYWLSKPNCQQLPCTRAGSWSLVGYEASARSGRHDIPADQSCPYQSQPDPQNETQTPLPGTCSNGVVQVKKWRQLESVDAIVAAVSADQPVVVATNVTESFFKNTGLISLTETKSEKSEGGHAYLVVGYMKLPPSLVDTEGQVCLLVANSWSQGWGKGGYACVTEKWFLQNWLVKPIAVEEIDL